MATAKVSELSGKALDYAVAMHEGRTPACYFQYTEEIRLNGWRQLGPKHWQPLANYSQNWAIAGPIIEREKITVKYTGSLLEFCAHLKTGVGKFTELPSDFVQYAKNPLIAAMRCYVASKMGEEIEIPDNLL